MMNVIQRLERLPVSKFHYKLLMVVGIGWLFDSMDTGIIAFVLPALAKAWNLTSGQMSWIVSIGLLGMAIGAIAAGWLADRFGRKTILIATLVTYSIATGLCGLAWNYESLLAFRFLVGFGLGGHLPVAVTLVSEFSPAKVRGRMLVLLESFWALGWLVAAVIAYKGIPQYGWKIGFFIGTMPILFVGLIAKVVPESLRFLLEKGDLEQANRLISKLEKANGIEPEKSIEAYDVVKTGQIGLTDLWSPKFAHRTLSLWILWFGIVYSYYGIFTWLPSLMFSQGHTLVKTFEYVLIMTIAQIPGYFAAAILVDVIGRKATLSSFLALSAVSAWLFGSSQGQMQILLWGSLLSFFNLGAWGVVYTYTPEVYPTRFRGSGSGWAAGVGRIGGILAPLVVGAIVSSTGNYSLIFTMFTAVLLITAICIAILGEETKGKTLDEINE